MIRTVYAVDNAPVQTDSGINGMVIKGTHWPADDPVVKAHPGLFSRDPRYGMNYTDEPEGWNDPVGPSLADEPYVEDSTAEPVTAEAATANPGERRTRGKARQ